MFCSKPHTIRLLSLRPDGQIETIFDDGGHIVFFLIDEEDYQRAMVDKDFVMPEIKTLELSDDAKDAIINGTIRIPADRLYGLGVKVEKKRQPSPEETRRKAAWIR